MLEGFWNTIINEDPVDMGYVKFQPYQDADVQNGVMSRLDWVVLKLYPIRDEHKLDYAIVEAIRRQIMTSQYSLTIRGVEFLNGIVNSLE